MQIFFLDFLSISFEQLCSNFYVYFILLNKFIYIFFETMTKTLIQYITSYKNEG